MSFQPVAVTRSYEQVVQQLETRIRRGDLAPGQRLPAERELSEQFGVSRSVIREAVKMLDAMGLIESRQGSGIYVRQHPAPLISRALTISVAPQEEQPVHAFYEFRELIETRTAYDAARLRTPIQLAAIEAACAANLAATSLAEFDAANDRFHLAISEAAGNPYFTLLVAGLVQVQREVIHALARPKNPRQERRYHQNILAAITAGDPDAAAAAMSEHIRGGLVETEKIFARRKEGQRDEFEFAADA